MENGTEAWAYPFTCITFHIYLLQHVSTTFIKVNPLLIASPE